VNRALAIRRRPDHDQGVANDGVAEDPPPPRGLTLWWPRTWFSLALWLLTAVLVSAAVAATLLVDVLSQLFLAYANFLFGSDCHHVCSEPPKDPWYQSPLLRFVALCLVPFAVMVVYQVVATVWVNRMRLPVPIRILCTSAVIVGGLALWWLGLGMLVDLNS
jgi:hypothetical protein